jgi:hypothetical protein
MKTTQLVSQLKSAVAYAQRSSLSNYRVASVNAMKVLLQLNLQKLTKDKKPAPGQDRKEFYIQLQKEAENGPLYNRAVLSTVQSIPIDMDKLETEWLGNQLAKQPVDLNHLGFILDWARGTGTSLKMLSYDKAHLEADLWHANFKSTEIADSAGYKTKNVVYKFPDGYTIVKVTNAADLKLEGELMGHCVGTYEYKVDTGKSNIYSLRDPKNAPHVTIEISPSGRVIQIQGKQNQAPILKYQPYVLTWLEATPSAKGWFLLVNRWEAFDDPEVEARIQERYKTDPSYHINTMVHEGFSRESSDYVIEHGTAEDLIQLVENFPGKLDYSVLASRALKLKNAELMRLVLVQVSDTNKPDLEKELVAGIMASGSPEAIYRLSAPGYQQLVSIKEIEAKILDSNDPEAPFYAAKLVYTQGWSAELQAKVETSKDPESVLSFYENQVEGGNRLDVDMAVAATVKRNDPAYTYGVLTTLTSHIKDPTPLVKILKDANDALRLGKLAVIGWQWRAEPEKVVGLAVDALLDLDATTPNMSKAILLSAAASHSDMAKLQKAVLKIDDPLLTSQFLKEVLDKAAKKQNMSSVDLLPLAKSTVENSSTQAICNTAWRIKKLESYLDASDAAVDICRDALCTSPDYVIFQFLELVRSTDEDLAKFEKAILGSKDPGLITSLLKLPTKYLDKLDLKKMEKVLFEIGEPRPLLTFYTKVPEANPQHFLKFLKDNPDLENWDLYKESIDSVITNNSQSKKEGFVRIAAGLRVLAHSAEGI